MALAGPLVALALSSALMAPPPPPPPPGSSDEPGVLREPAAKRHFAEAQEHFNEKDYAAAIPELKAAYAIEPNPMLLYAWAQAERLNGNCARSIPLYRKFLETGPVEQQRRLAEANIIDCESEQPQSPTSAAEPEPSADPAPVPKDDAPPPRPWYKDALGGSLVGVGAASLITGGVLVGLGQRQAKDALDERTEGDYFAAVDGARTKHTAGLVLIGLGSALVVGGIIRYAVIGARNKRKHQVSLAPGVFGLVYGMKF